MATGSKAFDSMCLDGELSCIKHPGMSLDILCKDHDVVLCSVCASETHISCIGLEPITKDSIIKATKKDFKHFGKDISEMKARLTKLKSKREDDRRKLKDETDKALKDIEDFRKLINWVLDRMERKGKGFIEKRHNELKKKIDDDIEQCEQLLTSLRNAKQQWKNTKDHQISVEQYVNMKKGNQSLKRAHKLCDMLRNNTHREIVKFTVDPKVERFARNLSWFGKDRTYLSFEQPLSFPHMYEIKQHHQFDIRVRGDKHVCCIADICQLEDGTILTVDSTNHRVKQLDVLYQVVGTCNINGDPKCVASLDKDNAIVAVDRGTVTELQFIELNDTLQVGKSFNVSVQCSGLACSKDAIYVSNDDKIYKFDTDGKFLQEIDTKCPVGRLLFTKDSDRIVFLDTNGRLCVLDKNFELANEVKDEQFTTDCDLAVDQNGQILVAMFESHSVVQYNHDLQILGTIAGPSCGIKYPKAIAFDRINNRLVVGMKFKNVIKAFELK